MRGRRPMARSGGARRGGTLDASAGSQTERDSRGRRVREADLRPRRRRRRARAPCRARPTSRTAPPTRRRPRRTCAPSSIAVRRTMRPWWRRPTRCRRSVTTTESKSHVVCTASRCQSSAGDERERVAAGADGDRAAVRRAPRWRGARRWQSEPRRAWPPCVDADERRRRRRRRRGARAEPRDRAQRGRVVASASVVTASEPWYCTTHPRRPTLLAPRRARSGPLADEDERAACST